MWKITEKLIEEWYFLLVIDLSQFTDGATSHQTPALLLLFLRSLHTIKQEIKNWD